MLNRDVDEIVYDESGNDIYFLFKIWLKIIISRIYFIVVHSGFSYFLDSES